MIHENDNIKLFTDSTGNPDLGYGAYCQCHWIYWSWPYGWETSVLKEMSFLELVPILLAMYLCGGCFVNKKIIMFIENSALVSIVNRQSSISKIVMMVIRRMVLLLLKNNILFMQHM